PETLAGLALETGATAVSVTKAARSGDVVIVTIPQKNVPKLPADLFAGVPDNVVVVDTGNYYPQQGADSAAGGGDLPVRSSPKPTPQTGKAEIVSAKPGDG